jgi:hypothetical protein
MAAEGMVHALRHALSLVAPDGLIVDLHPTTDPAHLEIFDGETLTRIAARIDSGRADGPSRRHAAADAAIAWCVEHRILRREASEEFSFWTEADSSAELRDYISMKWKQLHFGENDFRRAEAALAGGAGRTLVVTERVTASKLTSCRRTPAVRRNR